MKYSLHLNNSKGKKNSPQISTIETNLRKLLCDNLCNLWIKKFAVVNHRFLL